jgi:hypothetical protein
MSTDLLNVAPNERIDVADFRHAVDASFQENLRQISNAFLTPAAQQAWIIDGFAMTNPTGVQLTITRGRAILGQREGALPYQGVIVSEGDAEKNINMNTIGVGTFNVYLRFEYVDGDTSSRIFWDPTGTEVSQTHDTRRRANWSVRVESSSPGAEWLHIGTVTNTGVNPLTIVDQRPFYFEGVDSDSYESGWSAEGGGVADDRNADRGQYGVGDLQTFTRAMRQCLEDIRGRGLRRWWEKGIGGLNIGFDDDPTENTLRIGYLGYSLTYDGTDPHLYFDSSDQLWYDRSENKFFFTSGGDDLLTIGWDGAWFQDGVVIGSTSATMHDDDLRLPSGGINAGGTTNVVTGDGLFTRGLVVGYDGAPEPDQVRVGDSSFRLWFDGTDPIIYFDTAGSSNDYLIYDRSENAFSFVIGGTSEATIRADGLRILNGLYVGSLGTAATDNDIKCDGDVYVGAGISANATTDPVAGDGIFTRGVVVGYDGAPADNEVRVGDSNFALRFDGTDTFIDFNGASNYLAYDRSASTFSFVNSGSEKVRIGDDGIRILTGLYVGQLGVAPTADEVRMDGACHVGSGVIYFGIASDDYISMSEASNDFNFVLDAATEYEFGATSANFHGNSITSAGSIDGTGDLTMGSITMTGAIYTTGNIGRDSNDYLTWTNNTDMIVHVNGNAEFTVGTTGIDFHSNNISSAGSIDGSGDLTVGSITMTGFSVDADGDTQVKTLIANLAASAGGDLIAIGTNDAGLGQVGLGWDTDDQPVIWWDLARDDVWEWDQGSDIWRFKIEGVTEYEFGQYTFNAQSNSITTTGGITGHYLYASGTSCQLRLIESGKDSFSLNLGAAGQGLEFINNTDVNLVMRLSDPGDLYLPDGGIQLGANTGSMNNGELRCFGINFSSRSSLGGWTDTGDFVMLKYRPWFDDDNNQVAIRHTAGVRTNGFSSTFGAASSAQSLGLRFNGDSVGFGTTFHVVVCGYADTSGCTGTPWIDLAYDEDNSGGVTGGQIVRLNLPISSFTDFILECWGVYYSASIQIMGRSSDSTGQLFCQSVGKSLVASDKVGEFHLRGDSGTGASYSYTIMYAHLTIG